MSAERPWFEYRRHRGGFSGHPINAKGHVALLLIILLPHALVWPTLFITRAVLPTVAALLIGLGLAALCMVRIIRAKGRRID